MKYFNQMTNTILLLSITIVITMGFKIPLYKKFKKEIEEPLYKISSLTYNEYNYNIPVFENRRANNLVELYLLKNKCTYLDYNVYKLKENRINVFLDCGEKENYIIDTTNNKILDIRHEIRNFDRFVEKVRFLLELKYPSFVVESSDLHNGIYDIKENELVGYYQTLDYGLIDIRVNYNEIKGLLNYNVKYDKTYENEKFEITTDKKLIAFTYDDGPSIYDKELVDVLKRYHSGATFFEVGNRMDKYSDVIKYINNSGLELANHTFSHPYLYDMSLKDGLKEINSTSDKFKSITGNSLKLFRPSYGAINDEQLKNVNMPTILWNIDTLDWKHQNKNKTVNAILKNPSDGDIVLMHSLYKPTLEATKDVIVKLYKKDFIVVSISDLAKYKSISLENNKIYRCIGCVDPEKN